MDVPPAHQLPTLEEVARVAGVSRATVSRAINGGERVSTRALAAVERAISELGYTPNRAARSLVTRRTDSIALVVPETGSRFVADSVLTAALQGITTALSGTELQLILLIAQQAGDTARLLRYLRAGHVDGALVISHHGEDQLPAELAKTRLPFVFGGRPLDPGNVTVPYVDADNVGGGRIAARHLLERGDRVIGTVAGPRDMPAGLDRLAGWREVLTEAGRPANRVEHGDFTAEGGAAAMARLLQAQPDLDAVFVASDLMATGALRVIQESGRRVPDDIAVIGYDDSILAHAAIPPLTTVRQPAEEMGRRMAELLLEQLAGGPWPTAGVILPTELVVRASA
ncbi:MAG: LacI family DNA-binding transcriptional regulator [Jiangellaceae bacterium]